MSMAWHIAALVHTDRKKFPRHDRLMQRARRKMQQSQQQQMSIARMLNAMYGGNVVGKSEG
jgi:hypothetical protein